MSRKEKKFEFVFKGGDRRLEIDQPVSVLWFLYVNKLGFWLILNEKYIFHWFFIDFSLIFQSSSFDLGIGDDSTLQSWDTYVCPAEFKGPYNFTEVFRREVGALVTRDSLYRESLYTVVVPSGLPTHISLGDLMASKGVNYGTSDPWEFIRRHVLVSYQ